MHKKDHFSPSANVIWRDTHRPTLAQVMAASMISKGKQAEAAAQQWLEAKNYRLLNKNYACRLGEIDLVMLDKEILVFIEVRLRSHSHYGGAVASVDAKKQRKIIMTARHFLMCHPKYSQHICRFDVIAFGNSADPSNPIWYKDAFRL